MDQEKSFWGKQLDLVVYFEVMLVELSSAVFVSLSESPLHIGLSLQPVSLL